METLSRGIQCDYCFGSAERNSPDGTFVIFNETRIACHPCADIVKSGKMCGCGRSVDDPLCCTHDDALDDGMGAWNDAMMNGWPE